jgi:hypothetical protein
MKSPTMISDKFNQLFSSIFLGGIKRESISKEDVTILRLPLERTATEQTKYAQWLYGGRVYDLLMEVRDMELSESEDGFIKFNFKANTFTFTKPDSWTTDDFYFLFDFFKEKYLKSGYRVTDAIKEFKSGNEKYEEIESYVLIDSVAHHLIKLRVVSKMDETPQIIGWGYPTDDHSSEENQPVFFQIVKDLCRTDYRNSEEL